MAFFQVEKERGTAAEFAEVEKKEEEKDLPRKKTPRGKKKKLSRKKRTTDTYCTGKKVKKGPLKPYLTEAKRGKKGRTSSVPTRGGKKLALPGRRGEKGEGRPSGRPRIQNVAGKKKEPFTPGEKKKWGWPEGKESGVVAGI